MAKRTSGRRTFGKCHWCWSLRGNLNYVVFNRRRLSEQCHAQEYYAHYTGKRCRSASTPLMLPGTGILYSSRDQELVRKFPPTCNEQHSRAICSRAVQPGWGNCDLYSSLLWPLCIFGSYPVLPNSKRLMASIHARVYAALNSYNKSTLFRHISIRQDPITEVFEHKSFFAAQKPASLLVVGFQTVQILVAARGPRWPTVLKDRICVYGNTRVTTWPTQKAMITA